VDTGRILIVDDEPNVLRALVRSLHDEFGDRFVTTTDPLEAARRLESEDFPLLVTDYHMPGMDGAELLRRARETSPHTVRILITARADVPQIARAINTGAIFRFVSKPWEPADLAAAVRDALNYRAEAKSRAQEVLSLRRERTSLRNAVDLAAEIQRTVLPRGEPRIAGAQAACSFTPCEFASGDYLDLFPAADGRTAIVMGDVTGHGLGAALFVFTARALLRAGMSEEPDLARAMTRANRFLKRDMGGERFMTLFLGLFDADLAEIEFVNAGHPPPLIAGPRGVRELSRTALPLGLMEDASYDVRGRARIAPDECLLAYTDGVVEARDPGDAFFGASRLQELLMSRMDRPPSEIIEAVRRSVEAHGGGRPLEDDVSLLAIRPAPVSFAALRAVAVEAVP